MVLAGFEPLSVRLGALTHVGPAQAPGLLRGLQQKHRRVRPETPKATQAWGVLPARAEGEEWSGASQAGIALLFQPVALTSGLTSLRFVTLVVKTETSP